METENGRRIEIKDHGTGKKITVYPKPDAVYPNEPLATVYLNSDQVTAFIHDLTG